jgi:DNA-binding transcriptional ArsR family regulator
VFGIYRTPNTCDSYGVEDWESVVVDAFKQLDVPVERASREQYPQQADLILDPHGIHVELELKRYALLNADVVGRLTGRDVYPGASRAHDEDRPVRFLVADRITGAAREALLKSGMGYLDLRGHLGLHTSQMIIVASVKLDWSHPTGPNATAIPGRAGLEVASHLLMHPDRAPAVRELARDLGRSPSTVSQVLSTMRRHELVDTDHRVRTNRLFWEMADRWRTVRYYLDGIPNAQRDPSIIGPLRLGLVDAEHTSGWAQGDSGAAAALGAPISVRADQQPDFFVPDSVVVRRAQMLLGTAATAATAACAIRIAPVRMVCEQRQVSARYEWPIAHPVFVALDLAQDPDRGRQVLNDWTPSGESQRVW